MEKRRQQQQGQQQHQQGQQQHRKQKDRKTERVAKDGATKKRAEVVIDSEPKSTHANGEEDGDDGDCQNAKFFKSLSSSDFSDADKQKGGFFQSGKGDKSEKKAAVHRRIVCLSVLDILFGCTATTWCCGLIPCGLGIGALYYTYKSHPDHKKAYKLAKTGCGLAMFFMVFTIVIFILFFVYAGSSALDASKKSNF